ncbi:peptidoglycan DD-metalloendopeptidase family protein [Kaistia algarum]|uniref:peptidoglycan DD-metalloendopeptidase family protein n=1 Tax=Kaistia algarum TaxID=2083279 RepID=UPI001402563A|nr:peptidoglycan DD-metalloendopeptidase family protein [Kaistia algarum]MCX5515231.1 peptidoglycan DD-metalloendopeptidase family protein [Kaistia algarum]
MREPTRRTAHKPTRILLARGDHVQAIHIHPRTLALAGGALVLFSVLYFGATAYLFLRDDLLRSSGGQQERLLEGYEDRISALRNEIDRLTSRRAVDHATVAEKVDRLIDMQQTLEERQQMLARLADAARKAGFDLPPPMPAAKPAGGPQASVVPVAAPVAILASAVPPLSGNAAPPPAVLDQMADTIGTMESDQQQLVDALGQRVAGRTERIASILKRLGHKLPRAKAEDVGGPFVPIPAGGNSLGRFDAGVETLSDELGRLARARNFIRSLPLTRPIANAYITSGFGQRADPFLGRPAMHTGIDFRAERGTPARAVAAGKVIAAGWDGGYGNMVDIDAGNGIVTRYGHLSSIDVKIGDRVSVGAKVGRVGSTGRSTGPHLHYEIRVDGEPIDPMRYLNAADELAALQ